MQRPMATLGIPYFLLLIVASFLELKMTLVLAALCFFAFLTGLCVRSLRNNRQAMTVLFAAMAAFSMYAAKELLVWRPLQKWDGCNVSLKVQTVDFVQKTQAGQYVTVDVLDGALPKGTRLTLWIHGEELYPTPYDILQGSFTLSTPTDSRDGQLRGYSKSRGTYLNAQSEEYAEGGITLTEPSSRPFMYKILELQRAVRLTVLSQPGMSDVSGLMSGIAFGFRDSISSDTEYAFRAAGVSHLLAVSGMQTALLAQVLLALLLFLRVPKKFAAPVSAAGVLFFMALTGFTASVMRAGIMSILFLAGLMLGREADSLNSLGMSVLLITIVNPYAVNDAGLLLSFAATFGLLVLSPRFQKAMAGKLEERGGRLRLLAHPVKAVAVTLAATIPTLPVILFIFGQISLVSPVSNLLMVFPASAVTVAVCIGVLFSAVPFLRIFALVAFWVGKWITRYLVFVASLLVSLPLASVRAGQVFVFVCVSGGLMLVWLGFRWMGKRGARVMALWSVIALLCGILSYSVAMRGVAQVTVLQAGDGSAVLLERGGRTGLVLMGGDSAVKKARSELIRRNIRKLDFLMIPSNDDKCAYCPMILTNEIGVNCLIAGRTGTYSDTVEALAIRGGRLYWDEGTITFWNDCRASLNGGWLSLTLGKTRLLVCPSDGNASELTDSQRQTNLVVFTGTPPQHVSLITAQTAVLCCGTDSLRYAAKAVPQGLYPIYNTASEDVTVLTRGKGDLTVDADSYYCN